MGRSSEGCEFLLFLLPNPVGALISTSSDGTTRPVFPVTKLAMFECCNLTDTSVPFVNTTLLILQVDDDPEFEGDHIIIPIIVYLDKTTLDGLGRTSCFPLYLAIGNVSWDVYNETNGMVLAALLPCLQPDPDWPHPGWKPRSEAFKETQRYFMHWALSIVFESTRKASYTGFSIKDPSGVSHNAVPFIYVISKDLGEASSISGVRSTYCDSCLVPSNEMHLITHANQGGYGARLEDRMWTVWNSMHKHRVAGAAQARIKELGKEHGINYVEVRETTTRLGQPTKVAYYFIYRAPIASCGTTALARARVQE